MTFSETDLLLRAAIDGLGIALSRRMLAQPELDAGRLVRPVRHSVRADRSYFIVYPDRDRTVAAAADLPRLAAGAGAAPPPKRTHHAARKTA